MKKLPEKFNENETINETFTRNFNGIYEVLRIKERFDSLIDAVAELQQRTLDLEASEYTSGKTSAMDAKPKEWPCDHIKYDEYDWQYWCHPDENRNYSMSVPSCWQHCPVCGAVRPKEKA